MDYKETIQKVLAVLQGVNVQGRENWDRLLACDQALRSVLNDMAQQETEVK